MRDSGPMRTMRVVTVLFLAAIAAPSAMAARVPSHSLPSWLHVPLTETYGQVLNRFHARINNSDPDIIQAAEYALNHLAQGGSICPSEGCRSAPRVVLASKHIIEFTKDGRTPWILQFTDMTGRLHQRSVILGINYHFSLEWEEALVAYPPHSLSSSRSGFGSQGETVVHRFVVTRDRTDRLALLSHSSHRRVAAAAAATVKVAAASSSPSVSSPSRCRVSRSAGFYTNVSVDSHSVPLCLERISRRLVLQDNRWMQIRASGAKEDQPYVFKPLQDIAALPSLAGESGPPGRIVDLRPHTLRVPGWSPVCRLVGPVRSEAGRSRNHNLRSQGKQDDEAGETLRIVTYNVWNVNGFESEEYRDRIAYLARQIREEDPDIFALQEVRHDAKRDHQPETFANYFRDYNFAYQSAMSYPEEVFHRVEEGLAIVSKHPIVQSSYILLPRVLSNPGDVHQRICLQATVAHPRMGNINIFVTHLSLDETARDLSVVKINEWMQRFSQPQFLMGDLNAEPPTPAMRFLNGQHELLGQRAIGLFDVWLRLHPEPRTLYEDEMEDRDAGLTFNTLDSDLVKRIDYIFARLDESQYTVRAVDTVPRSGINPRCPTLGIPASDHVGLALQVVRRSHK
eukprot:m.197313 g.197313  ORF g.197313 m.197313 type:complete len:625 (+) comp17661_c0_seq8:503-2377(+)